MEWTRGTLMFYGGIAGAAVTLIAGIAAFLVLARGKKRIARKLRDEYGED